MFRFLLSKLLQFKRERRIPNAFSSTYVIGTTINDPRSLCLDWGLTSESYGVFVTNSENHNLIVAYLDLTGVHLKGVAATDFVMSLRAEAYETGSISMRKGTVKEYQQI